MAKRNIKDDAGHKETEEVLKELEERVKEQYKKAEEEIQEKLDDYLRRFEVKDKLKQQALANGQITQNEYNQWRIGQIMIGRRWEEMRDTIAEDFGNAAQIAKSTAWDYMPEVYAINHNYGTYQVENASHIDTSYTLYNRQAVQRLFDDNNTFYPSAGRKLTEAINMGKQVAWDKKLVQSVMTQGILQGESIPKLASRLAKAVGERDRKAAIRNARTMMTGVQNAGRIDAYERAEDMGIQMEKMWVATQDERTRHEHRELDGMTVPVDEAFEVDGYKIMYPADPAADPEMVYNCRCALAPAVKGHEIDREADFYKNDKLGDMTYEEWKKAKEESRSITYQEEVGESIKQSYNAEYRSYSKDTYSMKMASMKENDWSETSARDVSKEEKEDIIKYAAEKNINVVDLKGFDGDANLAKEQIDVISKYMTELPVDKKVTFTVHDLPDSDFGETRNRTIIISNKALRNKKITEDNLNSDSGKFASTNIGDIAAHEYGHVYSKINGINGLEVAKEAYYNVYKKEVTDSEIIDYLNDNISEYSVINKRNEIVSEVLAKDNSNRDDFTTAFVEELRRRGR